MQQTLNKLQELLAGREISVAEFESYDMYVQDIENLLSNPNIVLASSKLNIFIMARRLEEFLKRLLKRVEDEAVEERRSQNDRSHFGVAVTISEINIYQFPDDPQIANYTQKREQIEEELAEVNARLKAQNDAIKSRKKILISKGKAVLANTKYQLSVTKK